jgi:multimeric flavodoxin WrbA
MKEGNLKVLKNTIKELEKYKKVLLLTCSNRGEEVSKTQLPKSSILARVIHNNLGNSTIIDVTKLKIYPCEGNVSRMDGNVCGIKEALLDDPEKNPSGYHRCWASVHNPDDELWKISKELFESDCVVFFASVRWGQANMFYQKLIERLNWINNRFIPYGEENIIKNISSGFIIVGQHQYGDDITELQYNNHEYYGFDVNKELYWNWNAENIEYDDETLQGYLDSYPEFFDEFLIKTSIGGILATK